MLTYLTVFVVVAATIVNVGGETCAELNADPRCGSNNNPSPCSSTCGDGIRVTIYICDHLGEMQPKQCQEPCNMGSCPVGKMGANCTTLEAGGCTFSARSGCSRVCGIGTMIENYFCPNLPPFLHQCTRECCLRPCEVHSSVNVQAKGLCRDAWPAVKIPSNV